VTFRSPALTFGLLAAAWGLGQAPSLPAQEPGRLPTDGRVLSPAAPLSVNQQMANAIADCLRQSGQLRNYRIDIAFQTGTVELSGQVADQPQRDEVLRLVQGVPGVERVINRLTLAGAITPVQADDTPRPLPEPAPLQPRPAGAGPQEPLPMFQAPPPSPYDLNPPRMPPYAWPTYAPYNNYSRVGYPTAYPYEAWPFIGPCYPFPKIPLGWRSVKLEWQDGHWWFSKVATKYDWWRLKYW